MMYGFKRGFFACWFALLPMALAFVVCGEIPNWLSGAYIGVGTWAIYKHAAIMFDVITEISNEH